MTHAQTSIYSSTSYQTCARVETMTRIVVIHAIFLKHERREERDFSSSYEIVASIDSTFDTNMTLSDFERKKRALFYLILISKSLIIELDIIQVRKSSYAYFCIYYLILKDSDRRLYFSNDHFFSFRACTTMSLNIWFVAFNQCCSDILYWFMNVSNYTSK